MPRLRMAVPTDLNVESVVVLADLRHGRVPVDPCDDGKGDDNPMDPHGDGNGVSVDPRGDGGGNRSSLCGFLGAALVPAFLAPRSGVPADPRGDCRICRVAGQV